MSYWTHRKPVQRARSLDVDLIADAAIELLDAGGLRALTVRAVAARLDVAPASLYSRVSAADDLFDLALDAALGSDPALQRAIENSPIRELMLTYHDHLMRHRWACQVIGMRAPRGPHYLALSERMCALLDSAGLSDPLGSAYALSNFVIGSAMTAPMAGNERDEPVDIEIAPRYARLHAAHGVDSMEIVRAGLAALGA